MARLDKAITPTQKLRAIELKFYQHQAWEPRTSESASGSWPTPTASMVTLGDWEMAKYSHDDPNRPRCLGGQLNPQFREWEMGYPQQWTALSDWAMQWFRPKRVKRSKG